MKKVLLGLVIALMMTGKGFTNDIDKVWEKLSKEGIVTKYTGCDFLLEKAIKSVSQSKYDWDRALIAKREDKFFWKRSNEKMKEAHAFISTWDILCND